MTWALLNDEEKRDGKRMARAFGPNLHGVALATSGFDPDVRRRGQGDDGREGYRAVFTVIA